MEPSKSSGSIRTAHSPGEVLLGRFRIEKVLGSGGMGEVLLAHDRLLSRRVALKRLSESGSGDERRAALLKEARQAGRINDPRIAAVHDVVELDHELLLVMEYVEGVTLRERMTEPVSLETFFSIAIQCAEGIATAHTHGVIHRDLKPENLMLTPEGRIKILDFGIAKRADDWAGTTTTTIPDAGEHTAGTPPYMAPEAHLGDSVDAGADVFSLGVVFYELLTGQHPFSGPTYAAVVGKILNATPPPVHDLNLALPPALSELVARMLAKDPKQRMASAADLARQLEAVRRGEEMPSIAAPPVAPDAVALPRPRIGARPARLSAALLGMAVVVVASVLVWKRTSGVPLPQDRNLAVLAPQTVGASADFASFALGAMELLSARLERHSDTPGFQMASFTEGVEEKVATAGDARKILGATLAIVPTLEQKPDVLRARLDLMDTVREKVITTRMIEVPVTQPFAWLDRIDRESSAMLGLRPRRKALSEECGIRGAGTLRFYLQGVGRVRTAKTEVEAQRAIADLEMACKTEPGSAAPRVGLAAAEIRAYLLTKNSEWLDKAEASVRPAVALDTANATVHRMLGLVLATKRRNEDALPAYARAYALSPENDDVCSRLGRSYARLGQDEKERQVYLSVIGRRPHCWRPYWWLATWYFREGKVDSSVQSYRQMIRLAPLLHKGYSSLGGVLGLRGDYASAIDTLRRSIELRPSKVAFDNLGTAYFNSGRLAEAIEAYNQSFQFGFADYSSWLNLGDSYYWLRNRKDQAADAYRQAIRLGQEEIVTRGREGHSIDIMIPAQLAIAFPKLGERDSARTYLRRAIEADSTNYIVAYCAALTLWQLDQRAEALHWLEKSVRGGYPVVWLRDSPIFREWRGLAEFQAILDRLAPEPRQAAFLR